MLCYVHLYTCTICQIVCMVTIISCNEPMSRCLTPILEIRTLGSLGLVTCPKVRDLMAVKPRLESLYLFSKGLAETRLEKGDRKGLYWEEWIWWYRDGKFGFLYLVKSNHGLFLPRKVTWCKQCSNISKILTLRKWTCNWIAHINNLFYLTWNNEGIVLVLLRIFDLWQVSKFYFLWGLKAVSYNGLRELVHVLSQPMESRKLFSSS